jgi:hypothetical protein
MTDKTPAQTHLHSDTHAVEVRDAQSAVDEAGKGSHTVSPPGEDLRADLELVRGLIAAYGTNGVRRMIDSLT